VNNKSSFGNLAQLQSDGRGITNNALTQLFAGEVDAYGKPVDPQKIIDYRLTKPMSYESHAGIGEKFSNYA
jgi:hypothetical protein